MPLDLTTLRFDAELTLRAWAISAGLDVEIVAARRVLVAETSAACERSAAAIPTVTPRTANDFALVALC